MSGHMSSEPKLTKLVEDYLEMLVIWPEGKHPDEWSDEKAVKAINRLWPHKSHLRGYVTKKKLEAIRKDMAKSKRWSNALNACADAATAVYPKGMSGDVRWWGYWGELKDAAGIPMEYDGEWLAPREPRTPAEVLAERDAELEEVSAATEPVALPAPGPAPEPVVSLRPDLEPFRTPADDLLMRAYLDKTDPDWRAKAAGFLSLPQKPPPEPRKEPPHSPSGWPGTDQ